MRMAQEKREASGGADFVPPGLRFPIRPGKDEITCRLYPHDRDIAGQRGREVAPLCVLSQATARLPGGQQSPEDAKDKLEVSSPEVLGTGPVPAEPLGPLEPQFPGSQALALTVLPGHQGLGFTVAPGAENLGDHWAGPVLCPELCSSCVSARL